MSTLHNDKTLASETYKADWLGYELYQKNETKRTDNKTAYVILSKTIVDGSQTVE